MYCSLFLSIEGMLFEVYPGLSTKINYIRLGNWPTSVKKLEVLSEQLNAQIYLKDEGDCGALDENGYKFFGGNKVRKLEFLLADAVSKGYTTVLTYGDYASNHVVATACYAKQLGLQAIGLLIKQYPPSNITRNLLLDLYFGAKLFDCPQPRILNEDEMASFLHEHDFPPAYEIPTGGSNILGVLGVVNAVLELADQIAQGLLPEPDIIYVSFGSMGTTAGLLLGIKLAGLKSKVHPIKITKTEKYNSENLNKLCQETNQFLHDLDSAIPLCEWNAQDFNIVFDYIGQGYAYPTPLAQKAQNIFKELEDITLDQAYVSKVATALIDDCRNQKFSSDTVLLFWNSYCSYEYPGLKEKIDCSSIPEWMHAFI